MIRLLPEELDFFSFGIGDQIHDLSLARQALHHWAKSPALTLPPPFLSVPGIKVTPRDYGAGWAKSPVPHPFFGSRVSRLILLPQVLELHERK